MRFKKLAFSLMLLPSLGLAGESEAVLELLKALKAKGTIDETTYQKVEQALQERKEGEKTAVAKTPEEPPKITTKGKFEIASPDGDFKWRIRGRLHLNGGFARNDDGKEVRSKFEDGVDVRRARVEVLGTLWRAWDFRFHYEFSGSDPEADAGLRDIYLAYRFQDLPHQFPLMVMVGQFKEPLGLESLNSSNDMTFIERALGSRVFHDFGGASDGRRVGIGLFTHGHELWTAQAAVFGKGAAGNEFGKTQDSDPLVFTGRVTLAPRLGEEGVVHLGMGGSWLRFDGPSAVRFRAVPEECIGEAVRFLDTGLIGGIKNVVRLMPEAAVIYGPFSLQGEYQRAQLYGDQSLDFDAWYAQATWTLTGEAREYEFEQGLIRNPIPDTLVGKGGWGAWELAARYSKANLSACTHPTCAAERNFTAGLNWYVNPNAKLMFSYVRVLDISRGTFRGVNPDFFEASARVYF
jgi:phosphate-selective porin OprO/OprP